MDRRTCSVLALACSLLGCVGAHAPGSPGSPGSPKDTAPPAAMMTVADRAALMTPSCDAPPKPERPAVKPPHLGMCTE